ncbi:BPSS1780 family membrane protein [Spartinivicinus poritis]|uniref:BPSS1780 family membrane protein n=1 Tax=Spartinivicinus poritis TaxID=2994640 RepID=A0ABT5U650_9GAMM|nr:BPSS1780 family membrane protein [Spartinivicinus sp. A2-2]MDE1461446.1 BPSS1780 family membrane protein [Spartinivicinus sp. A2-2]
MTNTNPYKSPEADVVGDHSADLHWHEPTKQSAGSSVSWISDAFKLFGNKPGLWILATIVYWVIIFILALIPIVNLVSGFVAPIFTAGFIYASYKLDTGQGMEVADIFEGFQRNLGKLVLVAVLSLVFSVIVFAVLFLVAMVFGFSMTPGASGSSDFNIAIGLIFVLLFLGLLLPIIMMVWFAPALIILNNFDAWPAMLMSFKGCLRNILPFIIYGVLMLVMAIIAVIPLGLGYLVLMPVMYASIYTSYKSIYIK